MFQVLEAIEVATGASADAAVIWLHGLGADGRDFEPIVPELGLPPALRVRFVFPHAPQRPVSINMGMRMRAWYDILQLGGGPEDEAGIRDSQRQVEAMIEREKRRGVAAQRVVLAGFSQGGAIALQTGLRYPERLAGILALSTYLPLAAKAPAERHALNLALPVFMAHGRHDDMIPIARAELSRDALIAMGYPVEWREYAMPHSVCAAEIADIGRWLGKALG